MLCIVRFDRHKISWHLIRITQKSQWMCLAQTFWYKSKIQAQFSFRAHFSSGHQISETFQLCCRWSLGSLWERQSVNWFPPPQNSPPAYQTARRCGHVYWAAEGKTECVFIVIRHANPWLFVRQRNCQNRAETDRKYILSRSTSYLQIPLSEWLAPCNLVS